MRRVFFALLFLLLTVPCWAQSVGYESITVANTAIGLSTTSYAPVGQQMAMCVARLETAEVRYRLDGTAPTTTEGMLLEPGETVRLETSGQMVDAKFIRTGAVSGTLKVTCMRTPSAGLQLQASSLLAPLPAGTALLGKVGIDQTTPGTTNSVAVGYLGATAVATGQGVVSAGVQRMFLAQKASYTAATTAKTATAAGTGPFFAMCGSATTTIRVQSLAIGGTVATAAVYGDVTLRKTSAATSAGTATALVKVPHDSADAASTANLLNFYTVLATPGTLVGTVGTQGAVFPITATVAASQAQLLFDWTNRQESEAPVLRGTAQCLEAGFGTTTTNAPTLTVSVTYTEE